MSLEIYSNITIKLKTSTYFIQHIVSFNGIHKYYTDDYDNKLSPEYKQIMPLHSQQIELNKIPLSDLIEIDKNSIAEMIENNVDLSIEYIASYDTLKSYINLDDDIYNLKIGDKTLKPQFTNLNPRYRKINYTIPSHLIEDALASKLLVHLFDELDLDTFLKFNLKKNNKNLLKKEGSILICDLDYDSPVANHLNFSPSHEDETKAAYSKTYDYLLKKDFNDFYINILPPIASTKDKNTFGVSQYYVPGSLEKSTSIKLITVKSPKEAFEMKDSNLKNSLESQLFLTPIKRNDSFNNEIQIVGAHAENIKGMTYNDGDYDFTHYYLSSPLNQDSHNWFLQFESKRDGETVRHAYFIPPNINEQTINLSINKFTKTCSSKFESKQNNKNEVNHTIVLADNIHADVTHLPHLLTTYVNVNYLSPSLDAKDLHVKMKDVLPESIVKSWNFQFASHYVLRQKGKEYLLNKSSNSYGYYPWLRVENFDENKNFMAFQPTSGYFTSKATNGERTAGKLVIKSSEGKFVPLESGTVNHFHYAQIENGASFQFGNAGHDILYLGMKQATLNGAYNRGWRVIFNANNYKSNAGLLAH